MISYEPLYKTLKEKGVSTYKLINEYGISRSLLDRLKHNRPISTVTLNDLCSILKCKVEDVLVFTEDQTDKKGAVKKADFLSNGKSDFSFCELK